MLRSFEEDFERLKNENVVKGDYSNLEQFFELKEKRNMYCDDKEDKEFYNKIINETGEIKAKYFANRYHTMNNWIKNYLLAKEYYKERGNLLPIQGEVYFHRGYKIKIDEWVMRQRYLCKIKKLHNNQIKLLDEIGMVWQIEKRNYKDQEKDKTSVKSA